MRPWPLLLACAWALAPARAAAADKPAAAEESDGEGGHTLEIGLRGSKGREANVHDFDWGPTVSYELMTSHKEHSSRFKYNLELSYNDASTRFSGGGSNQDTRVRAAEFRYAKISLLELLGFDLKKKIGIVPYVAGGIQRVDSREDTSTYDPATGEFVAETIRDQYWSPTFGIGAEVALNRRLTLALDYDQNVEGGSRKVSRLNLELKFSVFGAD
jgi:opacity protein-like surface antigen